MGEGYFNLPIPSTENPCGVYLALWKRTD